MATLLIIPVFIQNDIVRQCNKCWHFGHSKKGCKKAFEVCPTCGEQVHDTTTQCTPKCINCNKPHVSSSKLCPVFLHRKDECMRKAEKVKRTDDPIANKSTVNPFMMSDTDFPALCDTLLNNKKKRSSPTEENNTVQATISEINLEVNPINLISEKKSNSSNSSTKRKRPSGPVLENFNFSAHIDKIVDDKLNMVFKDQAWSNQLIVHIRSYPDKADASTLLRNAIRDKISELTIGLSPPPKK